MTTRGATWVKICGITRAEDAAAAVEAGADAIGFVFYPPSPRAISPANAAALASHLPAGIARVGVFVDEAVDRMAAIRAQVGLDLVQLHHARDPAAARALRCKLIHAAQTPEAAARGAALAAAYPGDIVLVDGARAGLHGGTGVFAAEATIVAARRARNWILSGGLSPESVAARLAALAPWGVDVSSGVEFAPGIKDANKIAAFVAAVRASDRQFQTGEPGRAADRSDAHSLGDVRPAAHLARPGRAQGV